MRALVGGLGFLPVLPGSAVLTRGRWFCGRSWWRPGQAVGVLCVAWSVGFDLGPADQSGTMAPGIAAGIPSASEWPRGCNCIRGSHRRVSAATCSQAAIKPRFLYVLTVSLLFLYIAPHDTNQINP